MKKSGKRQDDKEYDAQREFKKIEKLFSALEKDETLPTFGEHFMQCLILGTAENVNLKKMYPMVYKKLNTFYKDHKQVIVDARK